MDFVTSQILNFETLRKIIILLYLPAFILSEECIQTDLCKCETSTGVLDLSPLTSPNPNPRLKVTAGDYEYSYMPCIASKDTCGSTVPVAVCQKKLTSPSSYFITGKVDTAKFYTDSETKYPSLSYFSGEIPVNRTTFIVLECSSNGDNLEYTKEDPIASGHFYLKLSSPHACIKAKSSGGLSTGSVLLIILFVLVIVYFVGGILFMHFVRQAQGIEKIPNVEFWKELPLLIRDGFVFVFRGCKADTTYSQI